MDPNNINQTMPTNPVAPAAPAAPVAPVAPVAPAAPAASDTPSITVSAMPEMPTPVNPIINPSGAPVEPAMPVMAVASGEVTSETLAKPTISAMPEMSAAPSQTFQSGNPMVGATEAITMPNPPKEPDPVEEELKAPMKAADPVPGSIGSAISMSSEQGATPVSAQPGSVPNVAFNDPASAQQMAQPMGAAVKSKAKMDKKTLIMLCAIAGIVVVALAIVLVVMMNN